MLNSLTKSKNGCAILQNLKIRELYLLMLIQGNVKLSKKSILKSYKERFKKIFEVFN